MKRISKDEMSQIDQAIKEGLSDDDHSTKPVEEDHAGVPGKKGVLLIINGLNHGKM